PHRSDGAYRPDKIKDKSHDNKSEDDTDKPVAGGREFGGCAEALKRHEVERKCYLQADIVKLPPSGPPRRKKRNGRDKRYQRGNRVHVRKQEDCGSKPKD